MSAAEQGERLPRTLAALDTARRRGLHLGAQLYVSLDFETVADLAVGEVRPGEPLTADHLMLWLSSTKPLTAVAVGQLWEAGALDLDDPVARHVPEFAAGGKERVTVRHLLTHTGGVRMANPGWPERSMAEVVAALSARKLEPGWVPGEKAGYHQLASWFVLGEIVQRLDGRPFADYVQEEICGPLGMEDCWVGMPAERYRAYAEAGRFAPMFDTEQAAEGGTPREQGWDAEARVVPPSPAGNGYGPMRGLGRFYEALLAGGRPPGGDAASRILSPQAVEAMTARHRTGLFDHTFQHVIDWGLGFIVDSKQYGADTVPYAYGRLCSRRTYGHSGYRSSTGFADPVHRLVVALAMNGTPSAAAHEQRVREVLDAVYLDLELAAPEEGERGGEAR
ncbi:MAG TPA: serine hydrolase domain-containing protein [Thermoanaerobaculia bacterium]|nr:serine hydrolase domain-containing protein [Thermoanaerobaculia bacterium]